MANTITDNRTLVDVADDAGNYVGNVSPATTTATFISGTASIGEQLNNSERYVMYNAGSAQNWSNNVFYIWINCGVVGQLLTKAAGGFKIRFAGPTVTNYIEFYVGGSDSWPTAVNGGWVQFVVDIEGTPDNTGGTPPATSAIQHVGYAATMSVMSLVGDNCWMDEIRRLPDGSPGLLIQGQNGGTTDWTFADAVTQVGVSSGVIKNGPGGSYVLNAPMQIGVDDTTTHGFADTNKIILWDNQGTIPADHYSIKFLSGSGGSVNADFGLKTGTGDAAVGAQGCVFAAASAGSRWTIGKTINGSAAIHFYGCSFIHGGALTLDHSGVEVISSLYIDCSSALVSNSTQIRNGIVNAATADGVAFMTTDDLTDIKFCSFQFSDGHAVELTTPIVASQASKGNTFNGYGATASNDAAIYNNAGGAVTINVTDNGDTPTYRNGTSASTTVNAGTVSATVKCVTTAGANIQNARVLVEAASGGPFPQGASVTITRSGSTATVSHTGHGLATNDKVVIRGANEQEYNGIHTITFIDVNSYSYTVSGTPATPATGTITATFAILSGLTDVNGEITMSRTFPSTQPVTGKARKSTASPLYKTATIGGSVNNTTGYSTTVVMISDE